MTSAYPSRFLWLLMLGAVAVVFPLSLVPSSESGFSGTTSSGPNSFQAACKSLATPLTMTGFEHQSVATAGAGLFYSTVQSGGSVAIDSTVAHSGTSSLKLTKTSGVSARANIGTEGSTSAIIVARFYVRFPTLPTTMAQNLYVINVTQVYDAAFTYDVASGRFKGQFWNSSTGSVATGSAKLAIDGSGNPLTVSTNTWYRIDMKADFGANPHTLDWQVDGIAQTRSVSSAEAATYVYLYNAIGGTGSDVFTMYIDDLVLSTASTDYPIGSGNTAVALLTGNGTSSAGSGGYQNDAGGAWNSGSNNSYTRMSDLPGAGGTDYIKQTASASTSYLEYTLSDSASSCIYGVRAIVGFESSSATGTVTGGTVVRSGSTDRTVFSGDMKVTTTRTYKAAMIVPVSLPWTTAAFDGLVGRIGYGAIAGGSPGPLPYWHTFTVEYATN